MAMELEESFWKTGGSRRRRRRRWRRRWRWKKGADEWQRIYAVHLTNLTALGLLPLKQGLLK
jgi:hypothetical protein